MFYDEVAVTAVFLVSSGGQCGDKQNMQISALGTLAWRTRSVGSDHKYWPPLEMVPSKQNKKTFSCTIFRVESEYVIIFCVE